MTSFAINTFGGSNTSVDITKTRQTIWVGTLENHTLKETYALLLAVFLDYDSRDGPVIAIGLVGAVWHDIRLKG